MMKPSISSLVANQLPDFARDDYPTFVAFLEAYYEYLEGSTAVDFSEVMDIDTTMDQFIQYFSSELSKFPTSELSNERFVLSRIRDYYSSKGTVSAFKLLFRLLFNKELEITLPSEHMFRVSDGKWVQDHSLYIQVEYGDVYSILGEYVIILNENITLEAKVTKITPLVRIIDDVETIIAGVFEIFVDREFYGNVEISATVLFQGVFSGIVLPIISAVKILLPGRNFKIGELYNIPGNSGTGAILKIKQTNAIGNILTCEFIRVGSNYTTAFTYPIVSHTDALLGVIPDTSIASIRVSTNGVSKYPGFYSTVDGFLDDFVFIQNDYYQIFSYDINVDLPLESYKSIAKTLLHPSGLSMFGAYSLEETFTSAPGLSILDTQEFIALRELVFAISKTILHFTKAIDDEQTSHDIMDLTKATQSGSNPDTLHFTKAIADTQTSPNDVGYLQHNPYADIGYFANDTGEYTSMTTTNF